MHTMCFNCIHPHLFLLCAFLWSCPHNSLSFTFMSFCLFLGLDSTHERKHIIFVFLGVCVLFFFETGSCFVKHFYQYMIVRRGFRCYIPYIRTWFGSSPPLFSFPTPFLK
jgi:hypothetical protein